MINYILRKLKLVRHAEYEQEKAEKHAYRGYLMGLSHATPHQNIKDEINELLETTPKDVANILSDYRSTGGI